MGLLGTVVSWSCARRQLGLWSNESPSHLPLLSMPPTFPASLMLHLCEGPDCHGVELWNTSLREASAWEWEQEDRVGAGIGEVLVSIMQGLSCSWGRRWGTDTPLEVDRKSRLGSTQSS